MAQQLSDKRDIDFVIWEQLDGEAVLENEKFDEFNRKTCELIIKEAKSIAVKELLPTMKDGDEIGVTLTKEGVKVPESFRRPFELLKEGEWAGLPIPPEMGGQGAPKVIGYVAAEQFMAANWAINCYNGMGLGTALMIQMFGTPEQRETYVKKLVAAEWGGTMLLTESDAGSDVGALNTTATRNDDGTYSITGNKIFITNGDHDLAENIIHPVLARIEGDPAGTKGISIFIVPKYLVNEDGSIGEFNDVVCTGVEEKHGIHGSATCSMAMGSKGNCKGYLLGEEREGMKIMFYMMNDARLNSGLQGLAYASAAYMEALNYARQRIQGRDLADKADRGAKPVSIIHHPDVRRNLLRMKSYVSGMRSFFYYSALVMENIEMADGDNSDDEAYLSLLTPILKDYLAVMGYEVCNQAIQVFGGAGYTKDYLVEQYARDCRIASIYEGTSGIQAMDLLGRKLGSKKGAVFARMMTEIKQSVNRAREFESLVPLAEKVDSAADRMAAVAGSLGALARSEKFKTAFAHSLPFLYAMGDVIMAWMLLWRAATASQKLAGKVKKKDLAFYEGEVKTAEFFICTEIPVTMGKLAAIEDGCSAAIDIADAGFGG
ncbi:MAG TPA: acyl-CoA dehydrogenase [Desulfobacteraceae bacterium]|nr:acyl-CoA dehydrogenase [Desulfobacteraceae bacterium]